MRAAWLVEVSLVYKVGFSSSAGDRCRVNGRGKSGLHWVMQGLTTPRREARNSGTERMSKALILRAGTGAFEGAVGVKTAKLCMEQDQIGRQ